MFKVVSIGGDGIGPEVVDAARKVLGYAGVDIEYIDREVGVSVFRKEGVSVTEETLDIIRENDACLFGATDTPLEMIRAEGYSSAIVKMRKELDLYANVRPFKNKSKRIDFVIVRECSEGEYSGRWRFDEEAKEMISETVISRVGSERVLRYAFDLARERRKDLVVGHKGNVLASYRYFWEIAQELVKDYPDVKMRGALVDSLCFGIMQNPPDCDVVVMPNLAGDIISDGAAYLLGGLGFAPSGTFGNGTPIFEPVHGTAPDIAGKNMANPVGAILSGAMMVRHLGLNSAADLIESAVADVLGFGEVKFDKLGRTDTRKIVEELEVRLK